MSNPGLQKGDRVCVTGASGFLGAHIVKLLLDEGHTVRATVRDPDNEAKTAFLRAMGGDLELVRADLFDPDSLKAAVADCPWVVHVAASTNLGAKDPQKDIVDVAVEGTRNLLDAVDAVGVARRVVLTSSIAAILDRELPEGHVYTEADWNESATLEDSPYPLGKTLAEKLAWERAAQADWDLVAINPTVVLGPVLAKAHARTSPAFVTAILQRKMPMLPRIHIGVCDVREVARAHLVALERPEVAGRFIVNAGSSSLPELGRVLRAAYPDRKLPKRTMPNLGVRLFARFDKRITRSTIEDLGKAKAMDNARSREVLGLEYRDVEVSIRDTAASLIDLGAV